MVATTDGKQVNGSRGGLHGIETKIRFVATMVSPPLAEQFIANAHPWQRREKPGKIATFIADMEAGRWVLDPSSPLCVSEEGQTVNGLNRCRAIVRCGKTVPLWICYDVPAECFAVMDSGTSRNPHDAARIVGMDVPSSRYHSAARQMLAGLKTESMSWSVQQTLDVVATYRAGLDFAFNAMRKAPPGVATASVLAVLARAWYTANRERLGKFAEFLVSGFFDRRGPDDAVILLRNWLLEQLSQRKKAGGGGTAQRLRTLVYARTEYALDFFLRSVKPSGIIEVSEEKFPLPDLRRFDA